MKLLYSTLLCCSLLTVVTPAVAAEAQYKKLYLQGVELNKKGDLQKAVDAYSKAIALKPDAFAIYFVRGRALRQLDQLDLAIADFSSAITLKPDYAEAYNERGVTYIGKGDKEKYRADFKKGCELKYENACANLKKFK